MQGIFLFDYGSFFFFLLRKAATYESIVEDVGSAEDYHPEAGDVVARDVCYKTLDEHHHSATEDHGHEDTAGDGRVFAETFHCHVEDCAPHHGSAKTYEQEGEDTYGNGLPNERKCVPVNAGEIHHSCVSKEHTEENEAECSNRHRSYHRTAADFVADGGTGEAADEHHEPVNCHEKADRTGGNARINEILLNEVGDSDFDAHIEENSQGTECEVLVRHSTLNQVNTHGGLFGFFNLGEGDDDEGHHEDAECNHQSGSSVGDFGFRHVGDERTHEDVASHSSRGVEHTTDLNQLVTGVTATAEEVEHGVHHAVEDSHAETGDESAQEVNTEDESEVVTVVKEAAQPLNEQTDTTDDETDECSLLLTIFGDQHTRGDTHHKISDEVTVVTDLCEYIRHTAGLVFNDGRHRRAQVCDEGNHGEESNHHDNRAPLFRLLSHLGKRF